MEELESRFLSKVHKDEDTGCWIWNGTRREKYGCFYISAGNVPAAHRWAYAFYNKADLGEVSLSPNCETPFCVNPSHYRIGRKRDDVKERIMRSTNILPNGCWEWTGKLRRTYGCITVNNSYRYVHRVSYELYKGPIPPSLVIDHLCCNRLCSNPEHLEAVTVAENNRRAIRQRVSQRLSKKWRELYRDLYREIYGASVSESEWQNDAEKRWLKIRSV